MFVDETKSKRNEYRAINNYNLKLNDFERTLDIDWI